MSVMASGLDAQFFGDDLCIIGAHAGTGLGAAGAHKNGIVLRISSQEANCLVSGVGLTAAAMRRKPGKRERHHESAAHLDEAASGEPGRQGWSRRSGQFSQAWVQALMALAASCTASMMAAYVPQRHRCGEGGLLVKASLICTTVGFGFLASNSTAAIIIPLWQ